MITRRGYSNDYEGSILSARAGVNKKQKLNYLEK